jgi:methylthioribose-1-phosphate isomerase
MLVNKKHFETIWLKDGDPATVQIIDQRFLPFEFRIEDINTVGQMYNAISDMHLRGAPLIGAAGALGMYLASFNSGKEGIKSYFEKISSYLISARPTAVNLQYAVKKILDLILDSPSDNDITKIILNGSMQIIDQERENCRMIGVHGLPLIKKISQLKNGDPVNILTHCNAGWLACIDFGTATAPIYLAHDNGIKVHVWVDETRPRNQGSRLTAWELNEHGVPHTVVTDNSGGHLMQHNMVDLVIVGTDRTTVNGDVANKIGTYLKALSAYDNHIPFYVALPSSSIDWNLTDGLAQIPIEQRDPLEVRNIEGLYKGEIVSVNILPEKNPVINYGFDVTPARLISGFITERGVCKADRESILKLFPAKITLM